MTRTYRAYNKRPLLGGPGLKGWVHSLKTKAVPDWVLHYYCYHPYKTDECFGKHCVHTFWEDFKLSRRRRREVRAYERKLEKEGTI